MRVLDLFSGIGGISLAADWAGFTTAAFCEIEPFPQKVLRKHWPDVPIFEDVKKLSKQTLIDAGVIDSERTIELICGGYPCQPFSLAGDRKGEEDDRHLWPEVKRLLQEIQPRWFVGENVAGHVTLGLDTVLIDLENIGYTWQSFVIPACAVNAPHRRDRVFIVANASSQGLPERRQPGVTKSNSQKRTRMEFKSERCSEIMANTDSKPGLQTNQTISTERGEWDTWNNAGGSDWTYKSGIDWWAAEPGVGRVANGVPRRVDRLKALGNAVVPQQIYPIFKAIAEIEGGLK